MLASMTKAKFFFPFVVFEFVKFCSDF